MWSTIHELGERSGLTVFLTTHYMHETEVADQVCVIDAGRIVEQGPTADIFANPQHDYTKNLIASLPRLHGKRAVEAVGAPK